MTRLLHIGLGKCGSTFLQNEIFPLLAKKLKIEYNPFYFRNILKKKNSFHPLENIKHLEKNLPKNFILSSEDLFSKKWEFFAIKKSFNYIKNNFSKNTTILIVIRNPYDLLNSIYCQSIQQMNIVKPENFFYINKNEKKFRKKNKYNLYKFNYNQLIKLYKSYFKKVIVVKHENLKDLEFLKKIFNRSLRFQYNFKTNKDYNKSISNFGINTILLLNSFMNLEKNQKYLKSLLRTNNNFIYKVTNKIICLFLIRNFFQKFFDKIFIYKKYKIKVNYIPIDIEKEIIKYNNQKF